MNRKIFARRSSTFAYSAALISSRLSVLKKAFAVGIVARGWQAGLTLARMLYLRPGVATLIGMAVLHTPGPSDAPTLAQAFGPPKHSSKPASGSREPKVLSSAPSDHSFARNLSSTTAR